MEQSVSKQPSSRGLRERVQARRSRAEKVAAARYTLERGVSGLRSNQPPPAPTTRAAALCRPAGTIPPQARFEVVW